MDLPWGDERTIQFVTNVGLITSDGPFGKNIMAAEWTHHVSYQPGLIAVCIRQNDTTHANIQKTKEFGINLAAADQASLASVAGGSHGREFDKISALKELGFRFYQGKKIKAMMVEGALLNIECRLFKEIPLGDHTMFVGEVVETNINKGKKPLAYHNLMYGVVEPKIPKPSEQERARVKEIVDKYKK